MRITLTIDDDVLISIKVLAKQNHVSNGKMLSVLVRTALEPQTFQAQRNGFTLLPKIKVGTHVNLDRVNRLREGLR